MLARSLIAPTILLLALVLPFTTPLSAQVDGTISGQVRDEEAGALAGATLTARSPALQRQSLVAISDEEGTYRLTPLPAGLYEIKVELAGFAVQTLQGLRVGINADLVIDWTLQPVTVEESLLVSAEAPILEVTRSELASRIPTESIENLPLNGRNFEDLVSLVPGVKPEPGAVRDQRFSVFGERPAATSYVVDGGDNYDPLDGGPFQRYAQDAIQEFEVITTGYEAEFGRAQGGVVNVLTRSGTNELKGSAFYFVRDDSWDSSNIEGQDAPKLERDQWGGSLGGPFARDKTFFFLSLEALDEVRGRNIDRSRIPDWVVAGLATPSGTENFDLGPGNEGLTALGKVDFLPSDPLRWSLSLNSTEDDAEGEFPPGIAGSLVMPSGARTQSQDSLGATLRNSWVVGENSFLDSTLKYLDGETGNNLERQGRGETALLLFLGNFIQTGAPVGGKQLREIERFQATQSFTLLKGSDHEIKLGYDVLSTSLTGFNSIWNDVEYSAAFFSPNAVPINEDLFNRLGFQQSAARFFQLSGNPDGSLDLDISNTDAGVFAQDKWQVSDNLSIDVGLRYDRASRFGDDDDNFSPRFGFSWDVGGRGRTIVKGSAGVFYDQNALVAASIVPEKGGVFTRNAFDVPIPRLGFEYTDSLIDLVITTGLFGGPPENPLYRQFADDLRANPFHLYQLLGVPIGDPSAPTVVTADNIQQLSGLTPDQAIALLETTYPGTDWEFFDVEGGSVVGDRVLSFFPRGPLALSRDVSVYSQDETPRTEAFTLGVEHQFRGGLTVSATYVTRSTDDLLTRRIVNLFDVPQGDPNFAQTTDGGPRINAFTYDGVIDYDGFVISLQRPFRGRYGYQIAYTHSDAKDNLITGGVGSGFSNNNHPELDYGTSNLSVPNVFVGSATARLPFGFRLSGIVFWRDGNAFSPRGVVDTDGDGLVDQRDLSVPRNSVRVDDYISLDLRAEKAFAFGDHEISLLVDVFNATNEDNVSGVNAVAGPDFGLPNSFFPGREIQVGARYYFGGR